MGRHGFAPITPFSAAVTIAQWSQEHGYPPKSTDCVGTSGLLWYTTYYKTFCMSTWSGVIETAFGLTSGVTLSMAITVEGRQMKRCYNAPDCPAWLVDEGRHVRFCAGCRRRRHAQEHTVEMAYAEPVLTRATLQRLGVGKRGGGSDLLAWGDGIDE